MRDYGKVHTSFWSSSTVRGMSEDARSLALYLLTSPHSNIAGVFRLPDGYVCEDLQWTAERVSKGFDELFSKGFANRCGTTKWVWVIRHLEWNPPENPNQRKAAAKICAAIPAECQWLQGFTSACGDVLGLPKSDKSNPSETVTEPFLNQYQEQEQKQEQDCAAPRRAKPKTAIPENFAVSERVKTWAARENYSDARVAENFAKFVLWAKSKDSRYADWDSALMTAIRDDWAKVSTAAPVNAEPASPYRRFQP